jgi:hypothetical protein
LIDQITGNDPSAKIQEVLGPDYKYYRYFKEVREMKGIQARMLLDININ